MNNYRIKILYIDYYLFRKYLRFQLHFKYACVVNYV